MIKKRKLAAAIRRSIIKAGLLAGATALAGTALAQEEILELEEPHEILDQPDGGRHLNLFWRPCSTRMATSRVGVSMPLSGDRTDGTKK